MIKFKKIKGDVRRRLNKLGEKLEDFPELVVLYLFGSYARREETELSDIDLAFYLSESDEKLEVKLYDVVSSHLKTDELTFISLRNAPLSLAHRIITEGKVIFERDKESKLDLEERLEKLYLDFLPLIKEEKKYYGN